MLPRIIESLNITTVPTTAGTGAETTGTAILDITSMSFKTGIANRAMKPILGVVDTLATRSCSRGAQSLRDHSLILIIMLELHISAGLDVLFHSLESYTAIPSVDVFQYSSLIV